MASKTLKMVFKNAAGGKVTLSVDDPKDTLTATEVSQAMTNIINQNIFTTRGGDLIEALEAFVVTENALV